MVQLTNKIIKRHNPNNIEEIINKNKKIVGKCPECGSDLIVRTGRFGSFVACDNYPKCTYIKKEERNKEERNIVIKKCPQCNNNIILKGTKNNRYLGCSNYPQCNYAEWIDETDEKLMKIIKDIDSKENNINTSENEYSYSTLDNKEKLERYSSQFKKGKREDLEEEVRSSWEANITRLFNYLGVDYSYETDSYNLLKSDCNYKFVSPVYLPDYILDDGTIIEVKGNLDYRSLESMKRFQELYPEEKIKIIDSDIYYLIEKKYGDIVPNWEKSHITLTSHIDIVGIKIKERIPFVAKLKEDDELILEREANNPYDKNAIKVLDGESHHIGYVDSCYACYLAPKLDLGIQYIIKLKEKKESALRCSIKPINIDTINIKDFLDIL